MSQDKRLSKIKHLAPGGGVLTKFNYTYDVVGNIKTWTRQYETNPAKLYDFGYDVVDQLNSGTLKTTDPTPLILNGLDPVS